jgi:predicted nucleic acid-binding protein
MMQADGKGIALRPAARRGRPCPVGDIWIAACCLTHNISRATLNLEDYEDYEDFASITGCAYWGWPSCGRSLLG